MQRFHMEMKTPHACEEEEAWSRPSLSKRAMKAWRTNAGSHKLNLGGVMAECPISSFHGHKTTIQRTWKQTNKAARQRCMPATRTLA
jgi:hypothetical protein